MYKSDRRKSAPIVRMLTDTNNKCDTSLVRKRNHEEVDNDVSVSPAAKQPGLSRCKMNSKINTRNVRKSLDPVMLRESLSHPTPATVVESKMEEEEEKMIKEEAEEDGDPFDSEMDDLIQYIIPGMEDKEFVKDDQKNSNLVKQQEDEEEEDAMMADDLDKYLTDELLDQHFTDLVHNSESKLTSTQSSHHHHHQQQSIVESDRLSNQENELSSCMFKTASGKTFKLAETKLSEAKKFLETTPEE